MNSNLILKTAESRRHLADNVQRNGQVSRSIREHTARYELRTYFSEDITAEIIAETSAIYRYVFNNSSNHFFINQQTEAVLSKADIPELWVYGKQYVPNEVIDDLYAQKYRSLGYEYWHDPAITTRKIHEKLQRDGLLVLARELGTDAVKGFAFGWKAPLIEVLTSEEWVHPYAYSKLKDDHRFERDINEVLGAINDCLTRHKLFVPYLLNLPRGKMELTTPIYCWNALGVTPDLWGNGHVHAINQTFLRAIPTEYAETLLQIVEGTSKVEGNRKLSNLEMFTRKGDAKKVAQLGSHTWLVLAPLKSFIDGFSKPAEGHAPKKEKLV